MIDPDPFQPSLLARAAVALAALALALAAASPASAQLHGAGALGGLGQGLQQGLGQTVGGALELPGRTLQPVTGQLTGDLQDAAQRLDPGQLLERRNEELRALVRANPKALELDEHGAPAVRGEVLAVSPSAASLAMAAGAGFTVERQERLDALGLELVVLKAPA